jgi:SAM-dependent methyltransferase
MRGSEVARTLRDLTRRYGRSVLTGKANVGYCLICERRTLFVESGPWLRDQYLCVRCRSIPRWRAMIRTLNIEFPNWRDLVIHESSPTGPASQKFRREAAAYSASQYLLPDVPSGTVVGRVTCQDLEALSFPNESFDLFITQDVMEHVLRPELAVKEIARVMRPNGAHVFTVPIHRGRHTLVRAIAKGSRIEHLCPPQYHGNPVDPNGSLVVHEWGDDFVDFVAEHSGLWTEAHPYCDRQLGLDGEYLEVFVTRKP